MFGSVRRHQGSTATTCIAHSYDNGLLKLNLRIKHANTKLQEQLFWILQVLGLQLFGQWFCLLCTHVK